MAKARPRTNATPVPDRLLSAAQETLRDRGRGRDNGEERSMPRIVKIFNAISGRDLTEREGYIFMQAVKLGRMATAHETGVEPKFDDFVDLAGYTALAAEVEFE